MNTTCTQKTDEGVCGKPTAFRYTWPGRDQDCVCAEHSTYLRKVADAIGLHLQLIPVEQLPPLADGEIDF